MFSVVIPLYNKQDFIVRCVRSVLAQSYSDFEVIVVDDGSSDQSVARLSAVDDPRLRVVQQANAGEGAARNTGMRDASRDWIAFLDADDYWFPEHLAELALIIESCPDAGMVATSYLEGEDPAAQPPLEENAEIRRIDYFVEASRRVGVVCSSAVAVRRTLSTRVGGFGPYPAGTDLEYWARMALEAPTAVSTRRTAYYYRNDQSVMSALHLERTKNPTQVPVSLAELWPSIGFIERVKDKPEYARFRHGMERYERNAVYLAMLGRVAIGDVRGARALSRLLPGRGLDKAAALSAAVRVPEAAIRLALRARRALRGR